MRGLLILLALMMLHSCMAGQFIDYPHSGRDNKLYVPTAARYHYALPLFVMLHGCAQNSTDFATGTNLNAYAETQHFFVVYPNQPLTANAGKCWNWFDPAHQARDAGEPALIVSIVESLSLNYTIDASKIYVGGLSAGGAMAVILGATYPDVFRGVAVGSATNLIEAFTAQLYGGPDPVTQGLATYQAMGSFARPLKVLVVHGSADVVVAPANGPQVATSFATALDYIIGNETANGTIIAKPANFSQVPGGHAYSTTSYVDSRTGRTWIQYINVTGMPHAWSGGDSAGTYTDPLGPNASQKMVQFFLTSSSSTISSISALLTFLFIYSLYL